LKSDAYISSPRTVIDSLGPTLNDIGGEDGGIFRFVPA